MNRPTLAAIVWDFDNTLIDTSARNRSVTRRIVEHVTERDPDEFTELRDQGAYDRAMHASQNWRDLYTHRFGMSSDQVTAAGRLWTDFQASDDTPSKWFPGILEALQRLAHLPHGIVSLNTRQNIRATLARDGLEDHFGSVVGCREVPRDRQKPSPDALVRCVEDLLPARRERGEIVMYVGDHAIDAECATRADEHYRELGSKRRVIAIEASYGVRVDSEPWPHPPAHTLASPTEIIELATSLRPRAE